MARFFDAKAALAQIRSNPIRPINPISNPGEPKNRTNRVNRVPPDVEIFEERAAIIEFDGGLNRRQAEDMAARAQGFNNVIEFQRAVKALQGSEQNERQENDT